MPRMRAVKALHVNVDDKQVRIEPGKGKKSEFDATKEDREYFLTHKAAVDVVDEAEGDDAPKKAAPKKTAAAKKAAPKKAAAAKKAAPKKAATENAEQKSADAGDGEGGEGGEGAGEDDDLLS